MTVSLVIIGILCLVGLAIVGVHWRPAWVVLGGILGVAALAGVAWLWPHFGAYWPILFCAVVVLTLLSLSLRWPRLLVVTGIVAGLMLVVGWFWTLIRFEAYWPLILAVTLSIGLLIAARLLNNPTLRLWGMAATMLTVLGTLGWVFWAQREAIFGFVAAYWLLLVLATVVALVLAGFTYRRLWAVAAWVVGASIGIWVCLIPSTGLEPWAYQWPIVITLLLGLVAFTPVPPNWSNLAFGALLFGPLLATLIIQQFAHGLVGGLYLLGFLGMCTFLARWARRRLSPKTA